MYTYIYTSHIYIYVYIYTSIESTRADEFGGLREEFGAVGAAQVQKRVSRGEKARYGEFFYGKHEG